MKREIRAIAWTLISAGLVAIVYAILARMSYDYIPPSASLAIAEHPFAALFSGGLFVSLSGAGLACGWSLP